MKKTIYSLMTLTLLAVMAACSDGYDDGFAKGRTEGYQTGYDAGYDAGHADGDADGYARAKTYFESAGYNEGLNDGGAVGLKQGYDAGYAVGFAETKPGAYNTGYAVGKTEGRAVGLAVGYDDGYDDGHADGFDARNAPIYNSGYEAGRRLGYNAGYDDGDDDGYARGYDDGSDDGYDFGYDRGTDIGYDDGYDDGFEDGKWDGSFGTSVGKTKKLRGYANLLSMAHNDIFDYSKIPAPKKTSRGVEVKGKLILSEVSLTNKDTMKRAAVVEQYLVVEMAKQVKQKFGLSNERSLKIAKASNHFRKYASKRALTAEDTNAYAQEIIGSDFSQIEKAYDEFKKGDLSGFDSVIDRAAEKNGSTPEKMKEIVTTMFI